ncbi:efflux transporter outer membrane subunit [Pseudoduganella sp. RAF53_2]|uniref:efflux transporter outer membrane subunit n=1 Tax=unclassified Pseudoduganella TaxID=2637179 RepID=UPI003F9AF250
MKQAISTKRPVLLRLSGLLAALVLAGCAVTPAYERPASTMPEAFHNAPALAGRQNVLPAPSLDQWWLGFEDPALERIVRRALDQNLNLAAAMARVDQARAAARATATRELPSGTFTADATRQRQSTASPAGRIASNLPGYDRNQSLFNAGAGASWELDLAGGLKAGTQQADAEAQAAEADQMGVRISIAAEAADAYFRVRGAQRRIALAEEEIKTDTRLLELVRIRQKDGLATAREAAQAEALLYQTNATLPPLKIERETQLNRLDVLMGAQPGTYAAELSAPGVDKLLPAIAVDHGPADLLRRRPDVIAAERRLAASHAKIGVATAEYYPHLTLSALLGLSSLGGGSLLTASAFQPQVGAGLRWRLFDFGRVDAEVAQAKGGEAEQLALYRQSMLRATEDVENAIINLTQLEQQHRELSKEVAARVQARDSAQEAYKGGVVSLFEALEEERQLLAARDQLERVHADNGRAAVATFRALGGGW